jgi:hypothetical protein
MVYPDVEMDGMGCRVPALAEPGSFRQNTDATRADFEFGRREKVHDLMVEVMQKCRLLPRNERLLISRIRRRHCNSVAAKH